MNNANFDMVDDILKYYESKGFAIYYEQSYRGWTIFVKTISAFDGACWKELYCGSSFKEAIAAMELCLEGNEQ